MERVRSLDSLRGIAAFVVVVYHFSLVVPGWNERLMSIWPLRIVLAGQAAVYVFFVLSGFVLYLSLANHDRNRYMPFAAKRIIRLYIPVAVAVILSSMLYVIVQPSYIASLQGWLTKYSWTTYPDFQIVAGHLALLDVDRYHTLNNPMWSLIVEVRLSLIFPLLAAAMRRWPTRTLVTSLLISAVCRYVLLRGHTVQLIDLPFTLQFLDLFAAGAYLAHFSRVVTRLLTIAPTMVTVPVALILLCLHGILTPYYMAAGATLLVAASFSYRSLDVVYGWRVLSWLGERSFSLYLIHVPLLLASVYLFYPAIPIATVLAVTLPACLIGAELFWRSVEKPSMSLSRTVGRRLIATSV